MRMITIHIEGTPTHPDDIDIPGAYRVSIPDDVDDADAYRLSVDAVLDHQDIASPEDFTFTAAWTHNRRPIPTPPKGTIRYKGASAIFYGKI